MPLPVTEHLHPAAKGLDALPAAAVLGSSTRANRSPRDPRA